MSKPEGLLVVISGPSGVGKGTVVKGVLKRSGSVRLSISATTREKRPDELDGLDYYFYSKNEFLRSAGSGQMLEYASYCGNFYGTPVGPVKCWMESGFDVLLEIEVLGAKQIKEKVQSCVTIFLLPPSLEVLYNRLGRRGTEGKDSMELRIKRAKEELKEAVFYDYLVVNEEPDICAEAILSIIRAEKLKFFNAKGKLEEVLDSFEHR